MSGRYRSELDGELLALHPAPRLESLTGLYLCEDLRALVPRGGSYVYTNFITSLDGRIALVSPETEQLEVPQRTQRTPGTGVCSSSSQPLRTR
jgi:hypothetical protein